MIKNTTTSISILLGAGFSAPIGYPVGNQLNKKILDCDGTEFGFHTDGVLYPFIEKGNPYKGYSSSYNIEFNFCRSLISYYNENIAPFDYEQFYDYLIDTAIGDQEAKKVAKPFLSFYHSYEVLIQKLRNIYNQIVNFYLKDQNGKSWHDDEGHKCKPIFTGYTGILNCLEYWGKRGIVNVHSLNHDLFFERLNSTDWLNGDLCDGFDEMNSPFYGNLKTCNRNYNVRLQYYNGKYNKQFRLFKLHGSRDYAIYYGRKEGELLVPQNYLKTRYGISPGDLCKEVITDPHETQYEYCTVNFHTDFLIGTTSKVDRYNEPIFYKKLFEYFRSNLLEANQLIIIGYGGKDDEVNNILSTNFDFNSKPCYIIDPTPSKDLINLQEALKATLIREHLENIQISQFKSHLKNN